MCSFICYSHGLRTGIFEASKLVLINFAPTLPEIQVINFVSIIIFLLLSFSVTLLICVFLASLGAITRVPNVYIYHPQGEQDETCCHDTNTCLLFEHWDLELSTSV